MDIEEYKASLHQPKPSPDLNRPLQALWYAAKGNWHKAHELVQDEPDADSAWVHAYLHRVEGDKFNAAYWYNRASRPISSETFNKEWEKIAFNLI
ncbi:hypothetical protein [Tunicatimonas pelagia]|uniref:hypothetical protein n=1 Tax=Tunicatimonas pelagia TaxID=931531 RepID=UPI00266527EA|nr:hypothetical protein [Tunicatimonas pelagia]WKN43804.1 hypothetical protein P0M28_02315 [Tunicatimonas pelagia]